MMMVGSPQGMMMVGSPQGMMMVGSPQGMMMVGSPQGMMMVGSPQGMAPPGQGTYQNQPVYALPSNDIAQAPMMPPGYAQLPQGYPSQPENGMHEAPPIETYDPTNANNKL
jgi:hypothetical protein